LLSEEIDCIAPGRILRNGNNTALAMDTDGLLKLCFLPAIKRMFGEYVMARKYHPNMVKEMFLKVSLYNMFGDMNL
jgi:hypothetical protein